MTATGRRWVKHGFRLALADGEALARAQCYLARAGVEVREFVFSRATRAHRAVNAIGNQTERGVDRVREIIAWPAEPRKPWQAGFLAGIFDAEGSCGPSEALRICNSDRDILERTESCMQALAFDATREVTKGRNGVAYIRLLGGLVEKLRFFHATDPAITRKRNITGLTLYSTCNLRVRSIDPLYELLPMIVLATETGDVIADGLVCGA